MYAMLKDQLADDLSTLKAEGLYKAEAVISSPQSARIGRRSTAAQLLCQ
jgi:hypothetical protein